MLGEELYSEGLEVFNENRNTEFKTEEEADEHIENISMDEMDLESLMYVETPEMMDEILDRIGQKEEILTEFYQNNVFPVWFGHWEKEGIEATRDNIENIYKRLTQSNPKDLGNFVASINVALNVAHQTGDMSDYVSEETGEDDLPQLMEQLSNGTDIEKWNKELRLVGVQP